MQSLGVRFEQLYSRRAEDVKVPKQFSDLSDYYVEIAMQLQEEKRTLLIN